MKIFISSKANILWSEPAFNSGITLPNASIKGLSKNNNKNNKNQNKNTQMPYFLYKIFETHIRRLEKLEQHDSYGDASKRAKQLRIELASGSPSCMIKVMFAETELHAEDLLYQLRAKSPGPGDD